MTVRGAAIFSTYLPSCDREVGKDAVLLILMAGVRLQTLKTPPGETADCMMNRLKTDRMKTDRQTEGGQTEDRQTEGGQTEDRQTD